MPFVGRTGNEALLVCSHADISSASFSLGTSTSLRVATSRSLTMPRANSDSPIITVKGIPDSSQY